ncbi:MAG: hypothetical protein AAGB34_11080, partial [Planctomycetota bacterium]
MSEHAGHRLHLLALPIALALGLVMLGLVASSRLHASAFDSLLMWLSVSIAPLVVAGAWCLSALGIGLAIRGLFSLRSLPVTFAIGVAIMIVVSNAMFSVWLPVEGLVAWGLLAPGLLVLAWKLRQTEIKPASFSGRAWWWVCVLLVPPIVTL